MAAAENLSTVDSTYIFPIPHGLAQRGGRSISDHKSLTNINNKLLNVFVNREYARKLVESQIQA